MVMMIAPFLLVAAVYASAQVSSTYRASCVVQAPSIVSRTASGVAQVSNLQLIQLECRRSPPRPVPRSGQQGPLKVEAVVYQLSESGARTLVPSRVTASGGGGDLQSESIYFSLDIPIDDAERDAATRIQLLELGISQGGRISAGVAWVNMPLDVVHFLGYFLAHEAHHRGQLVMLTRQLGHRLPIAISGGVWHWSKRAKEARARERDEETR